MMFLSSLSVSLALAVACSITAAEQPTGPGAKCSERCIPPSSEGAWVSNIAVSERVTSARLEWAPVPSSTTARYIVVWRNDARMEDYRQQNTMATNFELDNLLPGTRYTALVCRRNVNVSAVLPPPPEEPLVSECGHCFVCFRTDTQRYTFRRTEVSQVNELLLNLTCEVQSNAPFVIVWRALSIDSRNPQRIRLRDRDRFDGERVSIRSSAMMDRNRMNFVVTSTLTAPDTILEQNVDCLAESAFTSQPSRPGAFDEVDEEEVFPEWAIAVIVVVLVLFIISVVVLCTVVCVVCHRKKNLRYKEVTELTQLRKQKDYSNHYHESNIIRSEKTLQEVKPFSDPGMIDFDLKSALPEEMIIDNSLISVSTVIGQGEYGVVYKGLLRRGAGSETVAIKSLKGIFATEGDVQNALKEITKMKNFDHPNVMTLVGVCKATAMSGGAPSIIMPYMARGSLLSYLRKERESLMPGADTDITQTGSVQKLLMQICLQISKGMAYLASLRFVHRDLAARNCMIDEKGVIKVADFGLAEDIYMRNYFRQSSQDSGVKLPLKWMAPESIKLGIFSEKSDVWSYGVTCWEVFTAGEIPYPGVHPREVVQLLEEGQHLNRPKNHTLTDSMFGIMRSCWAYRSEDRPKFEELVSSLDQELTSLAEYVDLSMFVEDTANRANEE